MDDIFRREFQGPLSCRGFVKEDADGDYTVFQNEALSDEAKRRNWEHETEHIRRGDLSSDLAAHALEKILAEFDK